MNISDNSKNSTPLLGGSAYAPRDANSTSRRFWLVLLSVFGISLAISAVFRGISLGNDALNYYRGEYPNLPDITADCSATTWPENEKKSPHLSFPYFAEVSLDRVHIAVHYYKKYVRDKAKICLVDRKDGESGVGIFTPKYWRSRSRSDRLYFEVVLTLPEGTSPLYINRLATYVSNFSHDLDSLKDIINFGEITLKGSNGKIHARTIGAENATFTTSNAAVSADYLLAQRTLVRTSNAAVSGQYFATDSIDLITSNGAIRADVALNASDSKETKRLTMRTSNHAIQSTIDLATSSGSGGSFSVKVYTSNGLLAPRLASAPLDSVLALDARTSNSRAVVTLPSTYEGDLAVSTSNAVPAINFDSHKQDPRCNDQPDCESRKRVLDSRVVTKGRAAGSVYWDRENRHRGRVTVQTANAAASISI
ncbi:hypothetical protein B0H11DRAFT_1959357 [Mycena galericulata]|nr:hypothetical protein B0H11DRAFT_1959357 [Mycena galericulata]